MIPIDLLEFHRDLSVVELLVRRMKMQYQQLNHKSSIVNHSFGKKEKHLLRNLLRVLQYKFQLSKQKQINLQKILSEKSRCNLLFYNFHLFYYLCWYSILLSNVNSQLFPYSIHHYSKSFTKLYFYGLHFNIAISSSYLHYPKL